MWRVLVVILMLAGPRAVLAAAPSYDSALRAYTQGQFAEAASAAAAVGTADGDALAARALLVEAAYLAPPAERLADLQAAEDAARRALARDPDNVEGILHLVIALGYRARVIGAAAAHKAGYGRETGKLLKRARALDPENPWVYVVLGGWHSEITVASRFWGGLFYGAGARQARAAFATAIRLAPDNPVIRIEYAKILMRLDRNKYRPEAVAELRAAATLPPADAFGALIQSQGRELLTALTSDDPAALAATFKQVMPFSEYAP